MQEINQIPVPHLDPLPSTKQMSDIRRDLLKQADHIASLRYASAGIVCDENLKAVDYRGKIKNYLRRTSNPMSLKLEHLFSPDFAKHIHDAIHGIRNGRSNQVVKGVNVDSTAGTASVDIEIVPISESGVDWYFIFIIDKADVRSASEAAEYERHAIVTPDDVANDFASVIRRLKASNAWLRKRNIELVDARNTLEEERDHAEEVIQSLHQPLLILDESIRVVRANPAFLNLFGTTLEDVEMRPLNELCGGRWNDESLLLAMLQLMHSGSVVKDFEMEYPMSKDKPSTLSLNAAKIGWGTRALVLITIDDVTSKNKRLARLSEALQQKERFMTILDHDVREPMQPLHDAAALLQKAHLSVSEMQQARSVLNRQLDQMTHAIADRLESADGPSSEAVALATDREADSKTVGEFAQGVAVAVASKPPLVRKKILVVDDNLDTAAMCALSLTLEGHVLEIANDGRSALKIAQTFHPDIVVLDIGLSGMSGLDVAKNLRLQEGTKKTMIVGLSGYDQQAYRQQAEAAGFDHYLVKPSSASQLNRVIATYH